MRVGCDAGDDTDNGTLRVLCAGGLRGRQSGAGVGTVSWDIPDDVWEDEELGELVDQFENDPLISEVYENDFETDSED